MDVYDQEVSKLLCYYVNIKHKFYKKYILFRLYISVEKYMILEQLLPET